MHFLLIRHGESHVNRLDWQGGYVDAGLTVRGRRQVDLLAEWLGERLRPAALYTSTLARCRETAERLSRALGVAAVPDHRLREVGNCRPDGSPVPESAMPLRFPGSPASTRPESPACEGSESWIEFRRRVSAFVEEALARHGCDEPLLVVCHSGVIEAVSDHAFAVASPRRAEMSIYNTAITHWQYRDSGGGPAEPEPWLLHGHNLVYHLQGVPAGEAGLTSAPVPYEVLGSAPASARRERS
jgi:broad specificity phosphatase PhoE